VRHVSDVGSHVGSDVSDGSFDELGTPLHEVTFCVVDVETTGGSPQTCAITEVGAARYRGGERLGTFQTLVNPGVPVPPAITMVTGITEAMVLPAPRVDEVLPSLLEFVGGSVLVGHNLRFDTAFLDAALARSGRPPLGHHRIDTVTLARRLVLDDPDDVADCRLATLAQRFGLEHQPCHRALDDVLATADLLHMLLERAAGYSAFGLDDLLALPKVARHPQAAKLRLTARLPRAPGVYVFRDRAGRALRVGRAADLRSRVRSYFAGSGRGAVGSLLREAQAVDHVVCASSLEAAVLEIRLIHALEPRYNRHGNRWRSYRYVTRTGGRAGRAPRWNVTRVPSADALVTLGPVPSTAVARQLVAALESGGETPALARLARRQHRLDALRQAGRMTIDLPGGRRAELLRGRLVRAWTPDGPTDDPRHRGSEDLARWLAPGAVEPPPADGPLPLEAADELTCIAAWLDRWNGLR
jgi:DNA polymerase-3 subunit epsilon